MIGYILSLSSAVFRAIEFVFIKKLVKDIHPYVLAFCLIVVELLISLPFFFFYEIPTIESSYWFAVTVTTLCYVFSTILLTKTLKITDISLAMPLTSFVPIMTYLLGVFLLGETAGIQGTIGILVILMGNYFLYSYKNKHWYDPIMAPFSDKGSRMMLGVCILWAIANPFGKIAIESSSTFFYVTTSYVYMSLILIPILLFQLPKGYSFKNTITERWRGLIAGGMVRGLSRILMLLSFSYILVAYTISIKRLAMLFAVLIGRLYFKEDNTKQRLLACCIMLLGVLLIVFS